MKVLIFLIICLFGYHLVRGEISLSDFLEYEEEPHFETSQDNVTHQIETSQDNITHKTETSQDNVTPKIETFQDNTKIETSQQNLPTQVDQAEDISTHIQTGYN